MTRTSFDRNLTGFRVVETRVNDTLQIIAARELNDAARWIDIAEVNDLVPPYLTGISSEAGPQVKLFGQLIIVPAARAEISAQADPDLVFGTDVLLSNGDIVADAKGDVAVVSGRANLRQALEHRITTDLEELLFHQDYGCGAARLKGASNSPTASSLAAEYVRAAVAADPRVAQVDSAKATAVGDRIQARARARPIAGALIDISTGI